MIAPLGISQVVAQGVLQRETGGRREVSLIETSRRHRLVSLSWALQSTIEYTRQGWLMSAKPCTRLGGATTFNARRDGP